MTGTGKPPAVLLLGGRSEIGLAIVRHLLARGPAEVLLARRPDPARAAEDEATAQQLRACGARRVVAVDFDAEHLASHEPLLREVFTEHRVTVAVVAFGVLGNQEQAWTEVAAAQRTVTVNTTAAAGVGVALAGLMRRDGETGEGGTIIVLSSSAGTRVRRSNFVYGASKQATDSFYRNLSGALRGSGVRVLVVRPGPVATRMIAGRPARPLTVQPDDVARATVAAMARRDPGAGHDVVAVPAVMGPLMAAAHLVPERLWRLLRG